MLIIIQMGVILYTASGICSKMTSNYSAFSFMWLFWIGLEVAALGMYAIFWHLYSFFQTKPAAVVTRQMRDPARQSHQISLCKHFKGYHIIF